MSLTDIGEEMAKLRASGAFDADWYASHYGDVPRGIDPLEHYIRIGRKLGRVTTARAAAERAKNNYHLSLSTAERSSEFSRRDLPRSRPSRQLFTETTDMHGAKLSVYPSPAYASKDYRTQNYASTAIEFPSLFASDCNINPDVGIHLHIHYIELLSEFIYFLKNINFQFKLYISVTEKINTKHVEESIRSQLPRCDVVVRRVPNRGRDIASFTTAFASELLQHEFIGHIHSKRSPHNIHKSDWRDQLLYNIFGTNNHISLMFKFLTENKHVGLIFPEYHSSLHGQISWGTNFAACEALSQKINISISPNELILFPAGSMFIARSAALAPLLKAGLTLNDFPEEAGQIDGTLAHAVERMLGEICWASGFDLYQIRAERDYRLRSYFTRSWPYRNVDVDGWVSAIKEYKRTRQANNKLVVFTAVAGGYEVPPPPKLPSKDIDYVLFSDQPIDTSGFWDVRQMDYFNIDSVRMARYIKTHPHKYFSNYEIAVWIDANVLIERPLDPYIKLIQEDYKCVIGGIPHPQRQCAYEEAQIVQDYGKDDKERVSKQMATYAAEGFPRKFGLIETNFMLFNLKNPATKNLLDGWFREIERYSHRDQLSLNYVLWREGLQWKPLFSEQKSLRNVVDFSYLGHGRNSGLGEETRARLRTVERPRVCQVATRGEKVSSIDFVVCVHNALDDVRKCLESVDLILKGNDRLIIVDDGSDLDTATFLAGFSAGRAARTTLLRHSGEPLGYSRSANAGMRASNADAVLLLNSDAVVTASAITAMKNTLNSHPRVGIVGPLSNAASFQSIPDISGSKDQTAVNQIPEQLSLEDINDLCTKWAVGMLAPSVPLVHGFCQLIRKQVIETVGYFDEENFPYGYGEENDFCIRAVDAGFDLKVAIDAFVFHRKSASYVDTGRRAKLMKQGSDRLKAKHGADRVSRAVRSMESNPTLEEIRINARRAFGKLTSGATQ